MRYGFAIAGYPIRKSPDQSLLSAPRRLSQTATSFISYIYQDIPYVLFGELLSLLKLASYNAYHLNKPYLFFCYMDRKTHITYCWSIFNFSLETKLLSRLSGWKKPLWAAKYSSEKNIALLAVTSIYAFQHVLSRFTDFLTACQLLKK